MRPFDFAEMKIVERNYFRSYASARRRRTAALMVAVVVLLASSFSLRASSAWRVERAAAELAQVQAGVKSMRRRMAAAKKNVIERRWQAHLSSCSTRTLNTLNTVLRCAPGGVWLSAVDGLNDGPNVRIEGCATSFTSLSDMVGNLRQAPNLTGVQIANTRAVGPNGAGPIEFSLQVQVEESPVSRVPGRQEAAPRRVPLLGRRSDDA